jgi:hypothetical protein
MSDRNPDGHSPRWWRKHREARTKLQTGKTKRAKPVPERSYRKLWEIAVVIGGILGTFVAPSWLPWWFYYLWVAAVYLGFLFILVDGYKENFYPSIVSKVALIMGSLGIAWWTFGVVLVRIPLDVMFRVNIGGYAEGTDIGGILWKSNWSDGRIYLPNVSRYEITDVYMEISVDGVIPAITELEPVCIGFHAFPETHPVAVSINYTDEKGNRITSAISPSGPALANKWKVFCDRLPNESTDELIVPISASDLGNIQNPFPKQALGPNRLVRWIKVDGSYKALGKLRKIKKEYHQ